MSELLLTDAYEIAAYIKAAEKQTPIKLYIKGDFENPAYEGLKFFGSGDSYTVFGDASAIYPFLEANKDKIKDQVMEYDRRNSAIPLLDTTKIDARIEPGSFIRDHVTIGKSAVIMMGACSHQHRRSHRRRHNDRHGRGSRRTRHDRQKLPHWSRRSGCRCS